MASSARLDPALRRLAHRQHGVVTWNQLLAAGLSRDAIVHRVSCGSLRRVGVGVFAVPLVELGQEGRWMAAVLRCGPGALLSHHPGAALWELRPESAGRLVDITVPTQAGRSIEGVRVHRAATITEEDVTTRRGIPVTSLSRTLVDISAELHPRQMRSALRQAERLHQLDLRSLAERLVERRPSLRGARLLRMLDAWVPGIALTESELEALFLEVVVRGNLPRPVPQTRFGRRRTDFFFPDHALVVEVDGWDSHRGRIAFQEDRERDRQLQLAGYMVLRFTWSDVSNRPRTVVRDVRAALTREGQGASSAPECTGRA